MLVSFLIVAYNAEKFLNKSLGSLLNQDYNHKDIEVILVDGNSNDNTKGIMEQFKEKYGEQFSRVVILDNPKKTLPCGWNVALKEVKGDVVLRVDAHSFFEEDFITNNVNEIEQGEDIVGGKCISVTQTGTVKEKLLLIAEESLFGCGMADFRRKEKKEYVSTLAFAMYRKKVFDDTGKYNESLARTEDNEMHYRMKKKGYKFLLSPNIRTYRYARCDFNSMVRQKYGNGKWIGITLWQCAKCFSWYHFIPLLFVLAIFFSIIMLMLNTPIFMWLLLGAYGIFNLANIILIIKKEGFNFSYILLPIIFLLLHCAYGIGTLNGIIQGIFIKEKK